MSDAVTENSQELITDFVDEAVVSIRDIPDKLEQFRLAPEDDDSINAVFRAVHSIKGCAGFLGLPAVKVFSHKLENTMDEIRKRKIVFCEDLQRILVEGIDRLEAMLGRAMDGSLESELGKEDLQLLELVDQVALASRLDAPPEEQLLVDLLSLVEELAAADHPLADGWAGRMDSIIESYKHAGESSTENDKTPQKIEAPRPSELAEGPHFCDGKDVSSQVAAVLAIFLLTDPAEIKSQGDSFLKACEDFSAVANQGGSCELGQALQDAASDFCSIAESPLDLDAGLLAVVWDRLWPSLTLLSASPDPKKNNSTETKVESAANDKNDATKTPVAGARLVRVKEEKIDGFLEDVSSLFITGELLKDLYSRMSKECTMPTLLEEMRQITTTFNDQSAALQKSVVSLRRVPISGLFSKVPRMARTLATQLGKQVDVRISGGDVDIDKSLVEDLDAPLTHMIRNCMDHGIETTEERRERGVSDTGTIWLDAELTRTHVIITIRDDGRGINPASLIKKSVERGIYTQAEADALSREEALKLVFCAGLSTAEKLSDVSGRGVGMDVVRTNLQEHNGEVFVSSTIGEGTTFRMEIPIRDAVLVIDGLMCRESGDLFVIPFENVIEITEINSQDLTFVHGKSVVTVRDQTYAAINLGSSLGLDFIRADGRATWQAVLVGSKVGKICLLVDEVCGHRQIVLNSIQDILPGVEKIAGVAQLGGGRLALVLQVEDLVTSR